MTDAAFWDRLARKYAARPISNMSAYEQTLARVRSHLRADANVIELGCGTGTTALLLAGGVDRYIGTDLSNEMIAIAKEKQDETPIEGLSFAVSDANATDFEAGSFDAVLGFNLYHLVADPKAAMARANELLRPGGLFITKTGCIAGKWYLRPVIWVMQMLGRAPYVGFLSIDEYDTLVRDAGFDIVETGLYPATSPNRFVVARKRG